MYSYRFDNPRMTGVIVKEAVKCGKPRCKCARGKLHRWYYYLYYREWDGEKWRLRKEYVPKRKVKALRRKIGRWKKRDREEQRYLRLNMLFIRVMLGGLKGNYGAYNRWLAHYDDFQWMLKEGVRRGDFDKRSYELFSDPDLTGEP